VGVMLTGARVFGVKPVPSETGMSVGRQLGGLRKVETASAWGCTFQTN
jgi:hypothetical protein